MEKVVDRISDIFPSAIEPSRPWGVLSHGTRARRHRERDRDSIMAEERYPPDPARTSREGDALPPPDDPPAPGEPSDLELLRGMDQSPEECLRLLYRRWGPSLRRFLVRATGSAEAGEDLLQEAFLRILRSAGRFQAKGQVRSWMYRICANLAYSRWRRQGRVVLSPRAGAELPEDGARGPDSRRSRRLFMAELEEAVFQLPENQRMVFLLKADQGLTYREIASTLLCPEGTVKSRFHLAVMRLREALREWEDGMDLESAPPPRSPGSTAGDGRRNHRTEAIADGLHTVD